MRQDLLSFFPELTLIGTIFILFVIDFFVGAKRKGIYPVVAFLGIVAMMAVNAGIAQLPAARLFSGMVTFDPMGHFFHYLLGAASLMAILFSQKSQELQTADLPSYYTLIVALTLGMVLLATSSHLLMVYLSLEMVSVLSYILTGYLRGVRRSS